MRLPASPDVDSFLHLFGGWRPVGFALLTVTALELHQFVDVSARFTGWGLLSGGIGFAIGRLTALEGGNGCAGRAWLTCMLGTGAGLAVDCTLAPSALWLSVCTSPASSGIGIDAWVRHLQLMPATSIATLAAVLATHASEALPMGRHRLVRATCIALLEFTLMSGLMLVAIDMVEGAAGRFGLARTADAMGTAMVLGMFANSLLGRAWRRLARGGAAAPAV